MGTRRLRVAIGVAFALAGAGASADVQPAARPAIFVFDQPFWINLHQFLYVLGRARTSSPDSARRAVAGAAGDENTGVASLSETDRQRWQDAVAFYAAGPSQNDAVFDEPLVDAGKRLVDVGDAVSLDGSALDSSLAAALTRAAPIYRRAWWPAHQKANRERIERLTALLDVHGEAVLAYITRAYREPWPSSGYPVHLAAYANWAGAFSTDAGVLIVSSTDPSLDGLGGLETIFHEAMHQWDPAINTALTAEARRQGVRVPPNLSHAMIFFTAGRAVRAVDRRTCRMRRPKACGREGSPRSGQRLKRRGAHTSTGKGPEMRRSRGSSKRPRRCGSNLVPEPAHESTRRSQGILGSNHGSRLPWIG